MPAAPQNLFPIEFLDLNREEALETRLALDCRRRELGDAAEYLHRLLDGIDHRLLSVSEALASERHRPRCVLCGNRTNLDSDFLCLDHDACGHRARARVRRILHARAR